MVFKLHLMATLCMTGIIWFVQVNHYPMFSLVKTDFVAYELDHVRRTQWLIMPLMLIEVGTLVWMAYAERNWFWFGNLGLLILIWLSTFFIQVPLHNRLSQDYDAEAIRKLVSTNWIRTTLWTIRSISLLIWIKQ